MWNKLCRVAILLFLLPSRPLFADAIDPSHPSCPASFFTKSLHYTGEGMRCWYEKEWGIYGNYQNHL